MQKAKNLTQSLEYALLFCFFAVGGGSGGEGGRVKESLGGSCKDGGGGAGCRILALGSAM